MKKQLRFVLHVLVILSLFLSLNSTPGKSATSFDCATITDIPRAECEALVALYQSTNGGNWAAHNNWLTGTMARDWEKVVVTDGHVDKLYLIRNHLVGTIPAEIGNLTELTYLDLGGNQLSGTIPSTLWNLTKLTDLYLWQNALTGSISPQLCTLTKLKYVSFWNNRLSGNLPTCLDSLTQLIDFSVGQNLLTGPIPSSLGNLPNLTSLGLWDNALTGPIPLELGNLTSLTGLYLEANQLSGTIPPDLGKLQNLKELRLMANQLTGTIPPGIWGLKNLTFLGLRGNMLTGSIPAEIGNLTQLTLLDLRFNFFYGPLPSQLGQLTRLDKLMLGANDFTGPIPPEIGLLTNLTVLALHDNQLSGDIPPQLANLTNLALPGKGGYGADGLALEFNRLTVPISYPCNPPSALDSFLMVKDPDWYLTQAIETPVPTSGGKLTSRDSDATLTIPSGAVTTTTTVEYAPQAVPEEAVGELLFANTSFQLNALDGEGDPIKNYTFTKPVTVTLHYTEQDIQGVFEGSLLVYYWDTSTSTWKDAATTCTPTAVYQRDTVNHTLSVDICHFTEFALLGTEDYPLYLPTLGSFK